MSLTKVAVFVVVAITLVTENEAQIGVNSPENEKSDASACSREFLEWCQNRSHNSGYNYGVSIMSNVHIEGNDRVSVFCMSDTIGINCTRNGSPWYLCYSNGTLTYKGKKLTPDSGDDYVCYTKDIARNTYGPVEINFDKEAFEKDMDIFRNRMGKFEKDMENLGKQLQFQMSDIFGRRDYR
uniref:U5-Hexatoxin-Hf1a_1 n=1 Tax=Hadronyche formidabilis TaxID=426499 RepID=A0A4Q8K209_HADFO